MTISIQTILQNNLPLGYTGSIGYTGSQGAGFTGSSASGYTGSAGPAGQFAGLGYTGSAAGYTGSTGAGYTGSFGYTGSQGIPGVFAGIGYVGSPGAGYVGSLGGFNSIQPINIQTGTSYVIQSSDAGKVIEFLGSAPATLTIPTDSALFFSIGQRVDIVQGGAGSVFFVGSPGVFIDTADGVNFLNLQYTAASLLKVANNEWLLVSAAPSGYTGSGGSGFVGSSGGPGYAGSVGGFASIQGLNIQTGTTYTIQPSDSGIVIQFFNTATTTVTIPNDNDAFFYPGQRIDLVQRNTGPIFFNPGVGVTLNYPDVNYMNAINIGASLIKTAANEWLFSGPSPTGYTGSGGQGFTGSIGGAGYSGSVGGFASIQEIAIITATNYTIQSADAGELLEFFSSELTTVTIPSDNAVAFYIGQRIDIVQRGLSPIFFEPGLGVNLITPDVNYLNLPNVGASLIKTGNNEWLFTGPSAGGYTGSIGTGYTGSIGTIGYAGSVGDFASIQPLKVITNTTYIIQDLDAGKLLEFFGSSPTTVTIPPDTSLIYSIGQRIDIVQRGLGAVFFQGGPGVVLNYPDVSYINSVNIGASLIKTDINEWLFTGPSPTGFTGSLGTGYTGSIGTVGYAGSQGGFESIQPLVVVTATSYIIQSTDAGDLLQFFTTATTTVTIPSDNDVPFYVGQRIDIVQRGLSPVFFEPGVGVTLITPDVNYLNVSNVGASLVKTGANEWLFSGPAPSGYTGSLGIGFTGSIGTIGYAGSQGGFESIQPLVVITATDYTIQTTDAGDLLQFFSTATTTVIIPSDNDVFFYIGQRIDLIQRGLGAVFFNPGVGVTLNSPDVNYLNVPNVGASLIKTGNNEWLFTGPAPSGYTGSVGIGYSGSVGTVGFAGSLGGFASIQEIGIVTATNYTIQSVDAGDLLQFFSTDTTTVTIPNDSELNFFVGQRIDMVQRNTGAVFFVPGNGVTLNYNDVNYTNSVNAGSSLVKTSGNEWLFTGPAQAGFVGSVGSIGFVGSAGRGFSGSVGGFSSIQPINIQTGTSYTLQATDAGSIVEFYNSATTTLTVPNDPDNTLFSVGHRVDIVQRANSTLFVTPGSGVTLDYIDANFLTFRNSSGTIIKTDTNEWLWIGPGTGGFVGSGGFIGSQGPQGPAGGFTGSQGLQGYWGSFGYTGSEGYTGSFGYTGSRGYTGSFGYSGSFGYTGSKGYTGSSAPGYSGSEGVGYTGSFGYTGSSGAFAALGYSGSQGDQGPQGPAGGFTGSVGFVGSMGRGTAGVTRTYFFEGTLAENISNKRFYIAVDSSLYLIRVNLNSAGQTQSTIAIKQNGSTINTIAIPAGTTYLSLSTSTYTLAANDYLTVDITQASSAVNLYVTFVYREL